MSSFFSIGSETNLVDLCVFLVENMKKLEMKGVVNQFIYHPHISRMFHLYTNIRGLYSPPTKRALHTNDVTATLCHTELT